MTKIYIVHSDDGEINRSVFKRTLAQVSAKDAEGSPAELILIQAKNAEPHIYSIQNGKFNANAVYLDSDMPGGTAGYKFALFLKAPLNELENELKAVGNKEETKLYSSADIAIIEKYSDQDVKGIKYAEVLKKRIEFKRSERSDENVHMISENQQLSLLGLDKKGIPLLPKVPTTQMFTETLKKTFPNFTFTTKSKNKKTRSTRSNLPESKKTRSNLLEPLNIDILSSSSSSTSTTPITATSSTPSSTSITSQLSFKSDTSDTSSTPSPGNNLLQNSLFQPPPSSGTPAGNKNNKPENENNKSSEPPTLN